MFSRRSTFEASLNSHAAHLAALRAQGRTLVDLTISNPTDPRLGLALAFARSTGPLGDPRGARYQPDPRGLASARAAVCGYYSAHGATLDPAQIVLTASTSEAYAWLFTLLGDAGERILVPAPSYPLFATLAQLTGIERAPYPEGDLDAIRGGLEGGAVAVVVVHPNNPTGRHVPRSAMAELQRLCRAHGAAVIADEVFYDYALVQDPPPSHATMSQALTFTLSGLSKVCGLPGHKLGWIVVTGESPRPARALERLEVIADAYLSASTPVQAALPELLEGRHAFQRGIRDRLAGNVATLGGLVRPVEGGWTAVLPLGTGADDEAVAKRLLDQGVIVHPGYLYDFAEPALVLSLLTPPEWLTEPVLESFFRAQG